MNRPCNNRRLLPNGPGGTRMANPIATEAPVTAETAALPPWAAGNLDIHHISTGRGDAAFAILPDGTTLLVDAGELDPADPRTNSPRNAPARPNGSRPSYAWIARYIRRFWPHASEPALDYALVTHFHDDHFGTLTDLAPPSATGPYRLTGITGVGDEIPIAHLLDRGYPDYDYPISMESERARGWVRENPALAEAYARVRATLDNYRSFIAWQQERNGMRASQVVAGRDDQITLRRDPGAYPGFAVRNVAANGVVWSGAGDGAASRFPTREELERTMMPNENVCSVAIRISYGPFDYFTGADISGYAELGRPAWWDVETPVARAIGPTDVITLNHHGHRDTHNEFFQRMVRPRVLVLQNWSADQPGQGVLARLRSTWLYPGPRDMFANSILEANRLFIGPAVDAAFQSIQGHIVVRVEPGGERYWVYILDDEREDCPVIAIYGPYQAT